MSEELIALLLTNLPNFAGFVILAIVLVRQDARHEERIDRIVEWCFDQRVRELEDGTRR